jgi:signal transduction histidine kinase
VRHPGIVAELAGALEGERPDPLVVTLDDGRRSLAVHATPASEASGGGAVLVLQDITGLRTADRIRRDFVANVSHELRTPLTAVRGYIEALEDETLDADERQRFLGIVARHTGRMERLVGDLLRLARIEAGYELLAVGAADVAAIFQGVTAELAAALEARRLTVDVRVDSRAAQLACDPAKLHDALRNVLENAVRYSPEGGRITLEAWSEGELIALSVADEGPGIPEEARARIFERFYRVDKSRARSGRTGLGLSIVKHLVELHGGHVGSTCGSHGAVHHPTAAPAATPAEYAVAPAPPGDRPAAACAGVGRTEAARAGAPPGAGHRPFRAIARSTMAATSCEYVRPDLRAAWASSARELSQGFGLTSMT